MSKFYTHNGTEQQGPYTIEELKYRKITKDISVWSEGMTNWEKACNVDELKELFRLSPPLFKNTPPPFIKSPPLFNKVSPPHFTNPKTSQEIKPDNETRRVIFLTVLGIIFLMVMFFIISKPQIGQVNHNGQNENTEIKEINVEGMYSGVDNLGGNSTIAIYSSGSCRIDNSLGSSSIGSWRKISDNEISITISDNSGGTQLLGNARIDENGLQIIGGNYYSRK